MRYKGIRHAGMAIAGVAGLAWVVMAGSPAGSADITGRGITVEGDTHLPGLNYRICVSTPASANAWAQVTTRVSYYDGDRDLGFNTAGPGSSEVCINWAAAGEGTHNLRATLLWTTLDRFGNPVEHTDSTDTVAVLVSVPTTTPPITTTPPVTTPPVTTTLPPTTTPVAEWRLNGSYNVGDTVTYEGVKYRCIQAHTAYAPNWTPPLTPALWQRL